MSAEKSVLLFVGFIIITLTPSTAQKIERNRPRRKSCENAGCSTSLNATRSASRKWIEAFNDGDADGCAALYEEEAIMIAQPFGVYQGQEEIRQFWDSLIRGGFTGVKYDNVKWNDKVNMFEEQGAELSASWVMNKASGVIYKELWMLQSDGSARMRLDWFEAVEQF